ncbi:hypothetical protein ACW7G0_03805 [Lysobacter sp. A286]
MLDATEYDAISAIAKKAGVVRPHVIQALIEVADEAEVIVKARQLKAERKADGAELKKKRDAIAKLASTLDIEDIEALLRQIKGDPTHPQ